MDIIRINKLEVFANHGVLKEEKVLGQKFLISVDMYVEEFKQLDLYGNALDKLEDTVDYSKVCDLICDLMVEKNYDLIETVADTIAYRILLEFNKVKEVVVEVIKPWAPIHKSVKYVSVTKKMKRHKVYLGLGANLEDKDANLRKAIDIINADKYTNVTKESSFIETKPVGYEEQPDFLNAVIEVETLRSPKEVLELIGYIENELHRVRTIHWGPRTIDVDILLYDNCIINTKELIIPHKYMNEREFVLEPLCEIAPEVIHPVLGKSVCEIYNRYKENIIN